MIDAEVIIVLEDRIRAVGAALMMSTSAVSSAFADAVEACRRAEVSEYLTIVAQQIAAAESDPHERAEAELREIIALIAEELLEFCDAENGYSIRWYWPTKIYTLYDASDCRSVRSVEQKPSSYG